MFCWNLPFCSVESVCGKLYNTTNLARSQTALSISNYFRKTSTNVCILHILQLFNCNASMCSVKCSTTNVLLKTIIIACGIFLLNICFSGTSVFHIICCSFDERIISALCRYYDVYVSCNDFIQLFYNITFKHPIIFIGHFNCINDSHSRTIREIQSIRQKTIMQKLKIITIAQLLYSCILVICTFATNLSFSTHMIVICSLSVYPHFSAKNTVIYTNFVISVIDHLKKINCNFKKWRNKLYKLLFYCVSKVSIAPAS
ncbi:hypothetical protein T4B_11776, partial [Trichinella pseudospiralis]